MWCCRFCSGKTSDGQKAHEARICEQWRRMRVRLCAMCGREDVVLYGIRRRGRIDAAMSGHRQYLSYLEAT